MSDYDKYIAEDCDQIRAALREFCSGRWDWDAIDCCLTGKHADLDWHGHQGIELLSADEEYAVCTLHVGVTVAGEDVFLARDYETSEEHSAAVEEYLEIAQEIVWASPLPSGEWTGDDWYLYGSYDFRVPLTVTPEGDFNYAEAASEIIAAAHETVAPLEEELKFMKAALNRAAGYAED